MNKLSLESNLRNGVIEKFFSVTEDLFLSTSFELNNKDKEELLLREIFDTGRLLGLQILKSKNKELTLKEILEEIYNLNISCLSGKVEISENHLKIERKTCPYNSKNYLICLYWREFIDGFVMGIGDKERYSRHASINYALNKSCIDVIYYDDYEQYRWGIVPQNILSFIELQNDKYSIKNIKIEAIGFNEKTLFYKIKDLGEISSFRKGFIKEYFEKNFKKKFPDFEAFEMSPKAVIEGDF